MKLMSIQLLGPIHTVKVYYSAAVFIKFLFVIFILILIILTIYVLSYFFYDWWIKRGVKEIIPSTQSPGGGGDDDDNLWNKIKNKVKNLFGRK